jgi:hypothetical protein
VIYTRIHFKVVTVQKLGTGLASVRSELVQLAKQIVKTNKMKKNLAITMATLALASSALATPVTQVSYPITSDHATGGLGTAPFGTVTLTEAGGNLDVSVSLNAGYFFVLTGAADFQDFKFNATGVAVSDISITQNAPYTLVASTGTYNGDGTGQFGFGITGAPGQGNGFANAFNSPINFHIANATIADLTNPNNLGILFVADLYSSSTGNTGPADVTPGTSVPDGGATVTMLGAALVGLAGFRKTIKK